MRKTLLILATALGLGGGATAAHAASALVVQLDDRTDTLFSITKKDGLFVEDANLGSESFNGPYDMTWDPGGVLLADVNVSVNIFEPHGPISDVMQLTGAAGSSTMQVMFTSDTEGGPIIDPLPGAISIVENGQFQTVTQFTLSNGDAYTWQFRSDLDVPEPAAWALMLTGFGALGAAMRSRRKPVRS
jgi:hypothetical protein